MLTTLTAVIFLSAPAHIDSRVEADYGDQVAVMAIVEPAETSAVMDFPAAGRPACEVITLAGERTPFLTYEYDIVSQNQRLSSINLIG